MTVMDSIGDSVEDLLEGIGGAKDLITALVNQAAEIAPHVPIVEITSAIAKTIANPSSENILFDIELAVRLVKQFKTDLSGTDPSVIDIVKLLF